MPMGRSKVAVISDIVIDDDVDLLTDYQVKRLASPASGEALRKGNKDITNDEIADAANIVLTKLVDDYLLPTILATRGDMVYRASDHPTAIPAGTAGHLLTMGENDPGWAAAPALTKEFFVPVTMATEMAQSNIYPGGTVNATADYACMCFRVPTDYTSIVSAEVIRIAGATATHRLNYASAYGAAGEGFTTHTGSITDQDTAETNQTFYAEDVSTLFASLLAGDIVGVNVLGDDTNTPNDHILGLRFRYA